jgi:hypothetical protein
MAGIWVFDLWHWKGDSGQGTGILDFGFWIGAVGREEGDREGAKTGTDGDQHAVVAFSVNSVASCVRAFRMPSPIKRPSKTKAPRPKTQVQSTKIQVQNLTEN